MNFFTSIVKSAKATISAVQKWQAFANSVKPHRPFDPSNVPMPFDYTSLDGWAAHPDKKSKALFTVPGESLADKPMADVFFIHPTMYFGQDNWNQRPGQYPSTELVDEMIMPAQASVFNGSCRVFAPRFRQATFYVFLKADQNSGQALQVAFEDVVRAFRHYLQQENQGRPFFIAGHSQGALHATRLLEEVIDPDPQLVKQMVAAYPVGFQFPMDKFSRTIKNIRPSATPTDLHSIVSWDTFGGNTNPKNPVDRTRHFYKDKNQWELRYKKKNFGINPITFSDAPGLVPDSQHLGAVHVLYDKPMRYDAWWREGKIDVESVGLAAPKLAEVSAELRPNRFVYISEPKHREFKMAMLPGKNYHNYDYSLFYMNFRKNIEQRLNAYLMKNEE
ncbi:MAG: DUF3089 domain-containing protein [Bacteroidota bacterium]